VGRVAEEANVELLELYSRKSTLAEKTRAAGLT
jgi:hypothetical protein